jgi:hypothetical protein
MEKIESDEGEDRDSDADSTEPGKVAKSWKILVNRDESWQLRLRLLRLCATI